LEIIYEDENIICVNKQAGIPAQPDLTGDVSTFDKVKEYLGKTIYIINRIDRPVSGLILFSKGKKAARLYTEAISDIETNKTYFAVVQKTSIEPQKTIVDYLVKKNNKAYIAKNNPKRKKATLNYQLIGFGERYNFLQVSIDTGRFHQIRVQLANIGAIIKGDVKYGAKRSNKDRSICLHAYKIEMKDPFSNKTLILKANFPDKTLWKELSKFV